MDGSRPDGQCQEVQYRNEEAIYHDASGMLRM